MQLTFTEMHTPTVGLQIQVDRQLYTEQSDSNARSSAAFSRSTAT